jgi:lysozyme family protein
MYKENGTQEQRILELLKERGNSGVMAWEIPATLRILQYNARVFGLRKKGYDIKNINGKFVLYTEPVQTSFI